MRRSLALVFAIWAAAACAVDGNAPAPTAAPPVTLSSPSPTPTPTPIATRIAWPPMPDAYQGLAVRAEPGAATVPHIPALVPASQKVLEPVAQEFVSLFTRSGGFITVLQNLRELKYHGSEPYMFANQFAAGSFAESVRDLLTTPHPDQTRRFVARSATLERGWLGSGGVAIVEGTVVFDDEVATPTGTYTEGHSWAIRAFHQGGGFFFILGGTETGGGSLAPLAPFAPSELDAEVAVHVSQYLGQEQAAPGGGRPISPYKGTPYWDARKAALDWLFKLAEQGVLTDRHFEGMTAQVTEFTPTSYVGDGIVTVRLRGTLVEVMRGTRHVFPVDERVRFERTAAAHPFWMAVDGQDDNGNWLNGGNYTVAPEPMFHG